MTFSPVALGQEAKRISQVQLEDAVIGLGLNRQMTVGEFYKKNKYLVPDRLKKDIEAIVNVAKNQPMPVFEVVSNKGTSGESIPTLRVSQGGELINIQWFGEKNKFVKFQNTNLTEVDLINFNDMLTRIIAGDERFRKQIEVKDATPNIMAKKFKYPKVTDKQWKRMSARAQAAYIVNLRSLWQDARDVLRVKNELKEKKKKSSSYFYEQNQHFFKLFLGHPAEAARAYTAEKCIVAGYVSTYVQTSSGEKCSVEEAKRKYSSNELFRTANATCESQGKIACNPLIYGATTDGTPYCIDYSRNNRDFQKATHFDGPCDTSSRLQSSNAEVRFLNNSAANFGRGRYDASNRTMSEEELREHFRQDHAQNRTLTENYIMGILKLSGKVSPTENDFSRVALDQNSVALLREVRDKFELEINEARASCMAVSNSDSSVEPNFWQACDQLHRRFLFVNDAIKARCDANNLPFNPDTLCCTCEAPVAVPSTPAPAPNSPPPVAEVPAAPVPTPNSPVPAETSAPPVAAPATPVTEVPPGVPCPPVSVPPAPAATTADSNKPVCDPDMPDGNCICAGTNRPPTVDVADSVSGQTQYTCGGANGQDRNNNRNSGNDCGLLCKIGKGLKAVAPFAIAGVAAYFLFKWMAPKKPTLASPQDKCPNGSIPPCAQTCTPPLKLQPTGACSCDGCPPGQTADTVTCTCSTAPVNTTTILCPDSVTRAANLEACPNYPCWNGQSYKNPINCPPAPANPVNLNSSGVSQ